ncbi:peptidase M15 [Scytonema hofmannii PCC 7110]|uniref:Peptidase M15 n=1 Tax=Scytonema hofmannii PCC 7110 TaxID=128403 RepID=A0A139XEH7_9CYAN|nr:D-alanyl-D-alanine carboxypeptidase family protein [Scytonema hofmannii]KYC43053.1 peptidase M15 [Scytonema hofmannii PCC 7110]
MKRSIKNLAFIAIITFLACTLVASHGINRYQLRASRQSIESCAIAPSSDPREQKQSCPNAPPLKVSPTIVPPPTPNLSLPEKDRFLALVTYKLPTLPTPNTYEYTLLRAYGAAFVIQEAGIKLPSKVVFTSEQETKQFQSNLNMSKVNNTNNCYLQKSAADALNRARAEVHISLKSGYGASDCTRSFATNLRFWNKYATATTLQRVRQGAETNILGVVAPPGSSQHLWGLAIDLGVSNAFQEYTLNQNGWFRTVEKDSPHWTYLGLPPEKLAEFGFMNKVVGGVAYWLTPL